MSNQQSRLEKLVECPLCLDRYKNPKALPCLHIVCYDCIVDLIQSADTTVECPLCRECHPIPSDGAAGFRDSFIMNDLLSSPPDPPCEDCGTTEQGTSQCTHCQQQLCGDCRVVHATLALTSPGSGDQATVQRSAAAMYDQNQLPRNVDYTAKRNIQTTVLGGPNLVHEQRLTNPYGFIYSVKEDAVYVADPHDDAVRVYSADGTTGRVFSLLPNPVDVAIGKDHIFVLQRTAINAFNKDGDELAFQTTHFDGTPLTSCQVIQLYNDTIAVLDHEHKIVILFDERGQYVRHIGGFTDPCRMAIGGDDKIYVTDRVSRQDRKWCVKIHDWDGTPRGRIDLEGTRLGICVDADGFLCVGGKGAIYVYNPDHEFVCKIDDPAHRGGWIHHLGMIPDGRLIVNDWYTNLVYLL